ncbi:DEAD/DEAH box helicase family protein [Vulcanococcus limneticus Candia 3F8]|uniref:helicase-related protein n=1 Tax=Vulcanococcus limneticus TaxID=2170428 RepID=UPI000B98D934|nr:helicase-related protein [Vulcanococcus limneticus]MCP9791457.1 DEAD/DEAH box helicase family protein [Vulcanococcus limneticus MW73D5]MCP9893386.1 DEAD/DEAH box helicase family protein [Vulcanococcus limneticus Candia 3F8]MCP9896754.1 DEAD/DEAH box helicase family protein [Vulcanococcus limneticus Candia 3B3]
MSGLADHQWRRRFSSSLESLLEGFYRPALMDAVRYWRITGYFTSRSLLQVLDGVEQLVASSPDGRGHGQMRLITGVFLNEADIRALATGSSPEQVLSQSLTANFPFRQVQPGDNSDAAKGAELLAWLVQHGHLEIRVALPLHQGQLANDGSIFHAKEGVVEDRHGDRLGFSGSVNETPNGWTSNFETIQTFCSWKPGGAETIDDLEAGFLRLWQNHDEGARTFTLPEAVRQQLAIFQPVEGVPRRLKPYLKDLPSPEPQPEPPGEVIPDLDERRRIIWSYVLHAAASGLPGSERVGEATSAVSPWPHQQRAFQRLWQHWPPRLLIADEVGLGKTVQAGLLLRQSWLSGRASRILVMAPASVLKQWQRELREKFALDWPVYTGKALEWQSTCLRPKGESRPVGRDAWTAEPFVLVSSHLMRRRDRQRELLEAEPYDLVVLDEAHHARTRRETSASGGDRLRPNTLMQLMQQLRSRTQGLLLLTATPMQVSELEVWDLLCLLGMPSEWTEEAFERFFEWVEKENPDEATLSYLAGLWRSSVAAFDEPPATAWPEQLRRSPMKKKKVLKALKDTDPLSRRNLGIPERQAALALAKRWTPVQGLISRHSRTLLRAYKQQGAMDLAIGTRHVDDRFLPISTDERALYDAVEDFISTQYARASGQKKSAVGFVMTIYRRRLASSVAALVATLEKRMAGQLQQLEEDAAAAEDDDISGEQTFDLEGLESAFEEVSVQDELDAIAALLEQARPLVGHDSKGTEFLAAIEQLQNQGYRQVIVFSQYTDTVDALKQLLIEAGRTSLMCFTGRGGELLQRGGTWTNLSREDVKRDFKAGKAEILLCTDAAAEGLNFQFCGALINYDMPWNPMRVEQRIGRIDRIGQTHDQMQIINLHLDGTVEADVYKALKGRIAMFEQVVGKLQPILAKASSSISQATLVSREQREKARFQAVDAVMSEPEIKGLDLDDGLQDLEAIRDVVAQPPPLTLADLEAILDRPELLPPGCSATRIGKCDFKWTQPGLEQELRITCDPQYYEDNSDSCELWVPGSPLFPLDLVPSLQALSGTEATSDFKKALTGMY